MTERSKDWLEGYEVGYSEGESSANADWFIVLSEAFYDMTPEMGPKEFLEMLQRKGIAEK
jgi:hypothetical protein